MIEQLRRAWPVFWFTLAVNLFALCVAVTLYGLADIDGAAWLPVVSLALSGGVGLAALVSPTTRRPGAWCLGGTLASAAAFLVLLVAFFFAYFVLGRRELS